jgi:hypothetical protein
LLAGCAAPSKPAVWVELFCRDAGCPLDGMVLEIGDTAWVVDDGGVAMVESDLPESVRVVAPQGCNVFADFTAPPNSAWSIGFLSPGVAVVDDTTETGHPLGPSMGETSATGCP